MHSPGVAGVARGANAIDHLHDEWKDKPTVIITCGGHGGGNRAAQLRQITQGLDMRPMMTMPGISLTREMIRGSPIDPETDFEPSAAAIRAAIGELRIAFER